MNVTITAGTKHGRAVLRCVARIEKSKKIGIPRTFQKTWVVPFDKERCQYSDKELRIAFHYEASRWRLKMMKKMFGEAAPQMIQQEINNEPDATSQQEAPLPSLPEGQLVSSGKEPSDLHEGSVSEGEDIQ